MVIEHPALEDELGDVLEKAMRHAGLNEDALSQRAQVDADKIRDAIDYRYDFTNEEVRRLATALELNEVGLMALAQGRYPLPETAGLPFCLYPLRTPHGIGVANAYIVADCSSASGILFDTGVDYFQLRRVWPKNIRQIEAVFITHAETEHIGGLGELVAAFGKLPIFCPAGATIKNAVALSEGAGLTFGRFEVQALETPGHAEAHNCYLVKASHVPTAAPLLISGDTLFAGSTGAAFYCKQRMAGTLRRLLDQLPENTVVAPGHGPLTTIKNERHFNPFVH